MAGRAFVVAKEEFHQRDSNISALWEWLHDKNDKNQGFVI